MITNEFIAKIEGHGKLLVNFSSNDVHLEIDEGERLFEGILVNRPPEDATWITPRICGVCPIAHNLASLAAVEDALKIKITDTSKSLRDLMQCSQMIQSHNLHLFFLALPDYIGIDRGTELAKKDPKSFKKALNLKEIADEIAITVAGRNVHPTTTSIGGFHKIPTKRQLESLLEKMEKHEEDAKWVVDFFSKLKYPQLKVDLELISQIDDKIVSNKNKEVLIKEYKQNIEEELREYSTAKFGKFQGREIMVGALARLALAKTNNDFSETALSAIEKLDFQNPFHNNFAQAIEIEVFYKKAENIIRNLLDRGMDDRVVEPIENTGNGIGATEAPRGGLYHEIHIENGIITYANIITPTVQNLTSIEKSAKELLIQNEGKSQKEKERLLNMLVRAYDPCITCSVH